MEKKTKKSWFNVRLYLDGLRQLKIIGIMSAVIMGLCAILVPYGENLSNASYEVYSYGRVHELVSRGRIVQYDLIMLNPLIVATFLVIVPLMTLYLFNYLNRRNACDFYHAIPCTREGLFITYGAGIITWNIALILESVIISVAAQSLFKYIELNWWSLPVTVLNIVAACIFAFGVVVMAMSITGTVFTNVVVSAMILCVPRIFVSVIVYMITSEISVIPFTFGNSILNDKLNTVTNLVTGPVIRGDYDAIESYGSFAYTLIVGIIYCAVAMLLMKRRKSEAATSAAISRRLQCFFRLIPAMIICLIPISAVFDMEINSEGFDSESWFFIIVFFIIAIVAYFVYELMTTRKLKNLVKAVPGLLWLVVYNIAIMIVLFTGYNILLNDIPDVDDIKSVRVCYDRYSDNDYYVNVLDSVDFTSEDIKELLVSELSRNVDAIKTGASMYQESSVTYQVAATTEYVDDIPDDIDYEFTFVSVDFKCKGGTKSRYIYLSNSAAKELYKILCNNEQVKESFLAKIDKNDISNSYFSRMEGCSQEEIYSVYEIYMDELARKDFSQIFRVLTTRSYGDMTIYDSIGMNLKNGQYAYLPITDNMTETAEAFFELTSRNMDNPLGEFLDKADEIKKADVKDYQYIDGNMYVYINCLYDKEARYNVSANMWYDKYDENSINIDMSGDYTEKGEKLLRQIEQRLEKSSGKIDVSLGEPIIYVECSVNQDGTNADGEYIGYNYDYGRYYQVDKETIELIKSYGGY